MIEESPLDVSFPSSGYDIYFSRYLREVIFPARLREDTNTIERSIILSTVNMIKRRWHGVISYVIRKRTQKRMSRNDQK